MLGGSYRSAVELSGGATPEDVIVLAVTITRLGKQERREIVSEYHALQSDGLLSRYDVKKLVALANAGGAIVDKRVDQQAFLYANGIQQVKADAALKRLGAMMSSDKK